jgi:hypothetical protein
MTDATRTVVLKPGDTLLIGNAGQLDQEHYDLLPEALTPLVQALGLSTVTVFDTDIEAAAVAPSAPLPDAVVLRVFDYEAMAQHSKALADWIEANGIDPHTVSPEWLTIEQAGDQRFIRYPMLRRTEGGRLVTDPRCLDRVWTVERVTPLVIDLDLPESDDGHAE